MSNVYQFPFGEYVRPVVQEDRTPKKVFVLGVYASAVHAKWVDKNGKQVRRALAVASEPRIFWDGNEEEAKVIIDKIKIPSELGRLVPAPNNNNGPSAMALDKLILEPLGVTRKDAWLCDLLPETRLNPQQVDAIKESYEPLVEQYGLNKVTIPRATTKYCDDERAKEITKELIESKADTLILLGDYPIEQYLNRVVDVPYKTLDEYVGQNKYGFISEIEIGGKKIHVLPLAHPRQIAALGKHTEKWYDNHQKWLEEQKNKKG